MYQWFGIGTLVSWGNDDYGQMSGMPAGKLSAVAAGVYHSEAIALPDNDADGVRNEFDNCPATANADQADADADHVGDAGVDAFRGRPYPFTISACP